MQGFSRNIFQFVTLLGLPITLVLLLASCASTKYPPVPQDQRGPQQEYAYVIGPGDNLDIFVWGYEDLTVTVPVRPDGKITTRLVEDMQASGKTPTELARDIEKEYVKYVKKPIVSVTVSGFVGTPAQYIRVVGEANVPKSVPYRKYMTLLDLMIEVGGLAEFADGNKAVLIRNLGSERQVYNVRLHDLLKDGDISANLELFPGDILIIPEAWF